jgi:hypothetical protein
MSDRTGTEPIADDELLYRRIPVSTGWFDPTIDTKPSPLAFRPRDDDDTGLSVVRGEPYNSIEAAAGGPSKKGYYVAILRAGDLRKNGILVEPKPIPGLQGHAEIVSLTVVNRDSDEARGMMVMLAHEICIRVDGPFLAGATLPEN